MNRTMLVVWGIACAITSLAFAKPPLQSVSMGIRVEPKRIAKVVKEGGSLRMVGDWVEYIGFGPRAVEDACLYDCFGRAWGPGATGVPDDDTTFGPSCTPFLPAGSRWYFGNTYVNPFTEDDMADHANGPVTQNDIGWYFLGTGAGTDLPCFVAVFVTDGDANLCVNSASGQGVVYDFGPLPCDPGPYYFANADLSGGGFLTLTSADTGVQLVLAEGFDGTTLTLTAGQFMLWGAPNNDSTGYLAFPGAVGAQFAGTLDDDTPTDGALDPVTECYTYLFGVCPEPLGKMVAFGGSPECSTIITLCPSGPLNPSTQSYVISGTASGRGWSWSIEGTDSGGTDYYASDLFAPGVRIGGSALDLADAFAASINTIGLVCSGEISAVSAWIGGGPDASLDITVARSSAGSCGPFFDLSVGPYGACPTCNVNCTGSCSFNPTMIPFTRADQDCNANGIDDGIDVARGTSQDTNGNNIPDECECGGVCPADFNDDGFVSGDDFDLYVAAFELGESSADFNCDGFVSGDDFDEFVAAFESGC